MKDRIRKVMESRKKTQQEFADFIGVAPATLSSIFTGRTRPTLTIVEAIKQAMPSVSTDWLMFGKGEMIEPTSPSDTTADAPATDPSVADMPLFSAPQGAQSSGRAYPTAWQKGGERSEKAAEPQREPRRITEIRIFYDDQTWETFLPKGR